MTALPQTTTLHVLVHAGALHVTLARPERRNALSVQMLGELMAVFAWAGHADDVHAIVLRGAGGNFCAGADIKEMPVARDRQAIVEHNRRFGELASAVRSARQPVIAVIEGAVMGGGFGVVCACDVALACKTAKFALPETGLGLVPAQIAPFVVERIGLSQARRLMLTGARIDGVEAARIGLVHEVHDDTATLDAALQRVLADIARCAPRANAATKQLVLSAPGRELQGLLDEAAQVFADAALGDEAREGAQAFLEKRAPNWGKP